MAKWLSDCVAELWYWRICIFSNSFKKAANAAGERDLQVHVNAPAPARERRGRKQKGKVFGVLCYGRLNLLGVGRRLWT